MSSHTLVVRSAATDDGFASAASLAPAVQNRRRSPRTTRRLRPSNVVAPTPIRARTTRRRSKTAHPNYNHMNVNRLVRIEYDHNPAKYCDGNSFEEDVSGRLRFAGNRADRAIESTRTVSPISPPRPWNRLYSSRAVAFLLSDRRRRTPFEARKRTEIRRTSH